jgi:hypothetical protein
MRLLAAYGDRRGGGRDLGRDGAANPEAWRPQALAEGATVHSQGRGRVRVGHRDVVDLYAEPCVPLKGP